MTRKASRNVSISHGTLRTEDLASAFIEYIPDNEQYANIHYEYLTLGDWDSEVANWLLEDMFDALNELAPEGCYFGALPGDGSDFGFWEADDDQ